MSEKEKKEYTPPEIKSLELEYLSYLLQNSEYDWDDDD